MEILPRSVRLLGVTALLLPLWAMSESTAHLIQRQELSQDLCATDNTASGSASTFFPLVPAEMADLDPCLALTDPLSMADCRWKPGPVNQPPFRFRTAAHVYDPCIFPTV